MTKLKRRSSIVFPKERELDTYFTGDIDEWHSFVLRIICFCTLICFHCLWEAWRSRNDPHLFVRSFNNAPHLFSRFSTSICINDHKNLLFFVLPDGVVFQTALICSINVNHVLTPSLVFPNQSKRLKTPLSNNLFDVHVLTSKDIFFSLKSAYSCFFIVGNFFVKPDAPHPASHPERRLRNERIANYLG